MNADVSSTENVERQGDLMDSGTCPTCGLRRLNQPDLSALRERVIKAACNELSYVPASKDDMRDAITAIFDQAISGEDSKPAPEVATVEVYRWMVDEARFVIQRDEKLRVQYKHVLDHFNARLLGEDKP